MTQLMAPGAMRIAGASLVQRDQVLMANTATPAAMAIATAARPNIAAEVVVSAPPPVPVEPPPISLPMLRSRTGSLFTDRNDAATRWYLKDFTLHQDVDPAFVFEASQQGQEEDGDPASIARIQVTVHTSQPVDAKEYSTANPAATLSEIPLGELTATLSSFYVDENGAPAQRDVLGTVKDLGNGDFLLTFAPIVGQSVLGLYQDLTVFGKAQIKLAASFQAWAPQGQRFYFRARAAAFARHDAVALSREEAARRPLIMNRVGLVEDMEPAPRPPALVQTRQVWEQVLPLELKYDADAYQLKYTVTTESIPARVIRDANDLRDFTRAGSEFRELKALGDISQRYPSLSRAYVGTLSRTIIVIPDRYAIVRNRTGCAAVCIALVDTSATNGSRCKFEFDFTVAPEVSRIEFLQLAQEVANHPDLRGYKLKFPDFLQANPPSRLQTIFKSDAQFAAGVDTHTFAITASIEDDGSQTPAVANANLFISQICSTSGVALTGTLNLKLDDGFTSPLPADHADLSLAVDAQLALPERLKKTDVSRYLGFSTVDVAETAYVVAINAAGVNFGKLDSVTASITFSTLTQTAPTVLKLSQNIRADSAHIIIPLENAVFSLPGEVQLTVKFADASIPEVQFSVPNDFTAQPVLVLLQSDLDPHLPPAT